MEPDKELIAMCDIPEIQEKWEPEIGGMAWHKMADVELVCTHYMGFNFVDKKHGLPYSVGETSADELITFIPRIEDVLELLGDRIHVIVSKSNEELAELDENDEEYGRWLIDCYDYKGIAGDTFAANTFLQVLLKAYMYIEQDKKWNGTAWT